MKKSLAGTSIIESIVVLLVVVIWITWVYKLLFASQQLANSTAQRIEAIQIARDGLEAFTNIRDTNWLIYAGDYENCWNVLNYTPTCIWNDGIATRIRWWRLGPDTRKFIIYKDPITHKFMLEDRLDDPTWFDYTNDTAGEDYREFYRVWKDAQWFYTQGTSISTDITPIYTRTLQTDYIDTDWSGSDQSRFDDKIIVTSTVEWKDPASTEIKKLEMSTTLTNWKAKK